MAARNPNPAPARTSEFPHDEIARAQRRANLTPPQGGAAPDGGLDNNGATFPGRTAEPDKTHDFKTENQLQTSGAARWRLAHTTQSILRRRAAREPSVVLCGLPGDDPVEIHRVGGKSKIRQIYNCRSPWACPVCAPRCAAKRAEKVAQVIEKSHFLNLVTLTVRHTKKNPLANMRALVQNAARRARQGRAWHQFKSSGVAGVVVGYEIMYSFKNGWHFHIHALISSIIINENTPDFTETECNRAANTLRDRFLYFVALMGGSALPIGQDVRPITRE